MVSIITVVYNGEKTIEQTILSVCNQTQKPSEYIIVDGLSTDSTMKVIQKYASKYSFIKVISEKDNGIYDAMNKGIRMAKGEIIGIINSDDWYELDAIGIMLNAYRKYHSGVYYGILKVIMDEKLYQILRYSHEFIGVSTMQHPAMFITSDIYMKFGLFDIEYKSASDLDFLMRLLRENVPFYPIDESIAYFRTGGTSYNSYMTVKESLRIRKNYNFLSAPEYFVASIIVYLKYIFGRLNR